MPKVLYLWLEEVTFLSLVSGHSVATVVILAPTYPDDSEMMMKKQPHHPNIGGVSEIAHLQRCTPSTSGMSLVRYKGQRHPLKFKQTKRCTECSLGLILLSYGDLVVTTRQIQCRKHASASQGIQRLLYARKGERNPS